MKKQAESHRDLRFFRDQRTEKIEQVTIVTELRRQARVDEIVGFGSFIVHFFAFRYNLTETKTSLYQAIDPPRLPLLIHEFIRPHPSKPSPELRYLRRRRTWDALHPCSIRSFHSPYSFKPIALFSWAHPIQ
jgi:hypothetical protein